MKPIALQLYTVRDQAKADFAGTVRKVAEIGYAAVEPAGLHGMKPAEFRKLCDDLGMKISSSHCGIPTKETLAEQVDLAGSLGYRILVGGFGTGDFKAMDGIEAAAAKAQAAVEMLAPHGLKLAIHNHWWEFEAAEGMGGELGYDLMMRKAPGLLGELDIYWASHFGQHDVPAIVRKYARRLPLLHVKDGPLVQGQPHTAVGRGKLNIADCIRAADASVLEYLVVELDQCATDMLQAVRDSYDHLVRSGLGRGRK